MRKHDVVVLGAGIVGVAIALHLQWAGRSVLLLDRRQPSEETSFGNAGLIQREGVLPRAFPRSAVELIQYASNTRIDARYHPASIPALLPFLWRYWRSSAPKPYANIVANYAKFVEHSVFEHDRLATLSGVHHLFRRNGWFNLFRVRKNFEKKVAVANDLKRRFGVSSRILASQEIAFMEPSLQEQMIGGLHWQDSISVVDPYQLSLAYFSHFKRLGGRFAIGDANSLDQDSAGWKVALKGGEIVTSRDVVIALGAWADLLTERLGYKYPLAVKRGYHMHYKPIGDAQLNHPIVDTDRGYLLAPVLRGIRLTTGIEFAGRDAPRNLIQLRLAEYSARKLFPLGQSLDPQPWMGNRPCTPDMMPIVGPAPRHRNLWFAFGHAHHGLTLAGVTGRLMKEMVCGEDPFLDVSPLSPARFN